MNLNKFFVALFFITGVVMLATAEDNLNLDKQSIEQINKSANWFLVTGGVIFSATDDDLNLDKQPIEQINKKADRLSASDIVIFATTNDNLYLDKQSIEQINKKADRLFSISNKEDNRNVKLTDKSVDRTIIIERKTEPLAAEKKSILQIEKSLQGDNSERIKAYFDNLPANEKKRLMELYQQDAEKCREEINSKVYELKKQENSYQKTMNEIVDKYNAAQMYEEKQKYRKMLREASKKEFYRNLERSKTELNNLEKRLNALRQTYESRKNNADKIIDDQVEYLTRDPSLHW